MESKPYMNTCPLENNYWYLVQYDLNPQKFIRKIVKAQQLMWSAELQNGNQNDRVLIRERETLHLGFIIYRTKIFQNAIEQQKFIQKLCMQLLQHSPQDTNAIMENMHFNHHFWVLVQYGTELVKEEHTVFAIFHNNDVILKKDNETNNLMAYVQEKASTYKGLVLKVTNNIRDMVFTLNTIRDDLLKKIRENPLIDREKKHQVMHEEINQMEQIMCQESQLLARAFRTVEKSRERLIKRLQYLRNVADMNDIQYN